MARQSKRKPSRPVPDAPQDPSQPTTDTLPPRRYGGQELPDDVQDRPEQNAGYDEAAHGETTAAGEGAVDAGAIDVEDGRDRGMTIRDTPDELPAEERPAESPDDRAERDVVTEVRRRERRR